MLDTVRQYRTDVLVVGSGAAGARAALEASQYTGDVLLVSKSTPGRSGTTNLAGVHYAAAMGHDNGDSPWHHFEDTSIEARWLADQELALTMCLIGPKTVIDLESYGLNWYRTEDKKHYKLLPAPGHSNNRGVHFNGRTGKMVQSSVLSELARHGNVQLMGDVFITQIIVDQGEVLGATAIDLQTGDFVVISTSSVVLATGGAGMMYRVTDMETGSTGDGIAMAYRAGAELIDPEMHQFFPTAFVWPDTLRGVAVNSSQLWKLGLRLYNVEDERFMEKYFPAEKEHMPRDILSQRIFHEIQEGRGTEHGGVWQDTRWIENFEELRRDRARSYVWPVKLGIDPDRIEVAPTYHFTLGGVRVNVEAETRVPGLYACGEIVGATHGANRLAGNALTECMVFGEIAGRNAALRAGRRKDADPVSERLMEQERERVRSLLKSEEQAEKRPGDIFEELRKTMYFDVGILRDERRLDSAIERVRALREQAGSMCLSDIEQYNVEWIWALELDAMLLLAEIFARGAKMRTESRGAHYRVDFPETNDEQWLQHIVVRREDGKDVFATEPVSLTYLHDVKARYEQ